MRSLSKAACLLCPSAQPDMPEAVVFGIVGGSVLEPQVQYVEKPRRLTKELLTLPDEVQPTEVFRMAASCAEERCQHFDSNGCSLARRLVQILPAKESRIPPCSIRQDCRWWVQEGTTACLRCPQIVTRTINPSPVMIEAATVPRNQAMYE